MPKLPRVSSKETIKALERLGFVQIRQKGSHVVLKKTIATQENDGNDLEIGCVVPVQKKNLAIGTLKNILNQAGISVVEFIDNL
jgi:predicted RNA binding protein YcfA (HicA-like mRNA interferase family)